MVFDCARRNFLIKIITKGFRWMMVVGGIGVDDDGNSDDDFFFFHSHPKDKKNCGR